jgi:membrane fusion protein (multidrug efflux system)
MTGFRRTVKMLAWVAGLALLGGSLLGARHVWQSHSDSPVAQEPAVASERSAPRGPSVRCLGTVEVEGGLITLAPPIAGEVVDLPVKEGQHVTRGELLLRLDDTLARGKVEEAKAGVREAQAELARARRAGPAYEAMLAAKRTELEARKHELAAARIKQQRLTKIGNSGFNVEDTAESAAEGIKALELGLQAREDEIKALEANRPTDEVAKAQAAVERYQVLQGQAEYAVTKYRYAAPADGTLIQVFLRAGQGFDPQTARQPAFLLKPDGELLVRAEVDQEFAGRVAVGQPVTVQEEASASVSWTGQVTHVPDVFLPRRGSNGLPDPLRLNEPRVLEVTIKLTPGNAPPRVGQRVRVVIGGEG